jgi:hypothetical protein
MKVAALLAESGRFVDAPDDTCHGRGGVAGVLS